jgi:hypothetical protein
MDESSFVKCTRGHLKNHNSSINEKVISRKDLPTSARSLFQRTKDAAQQDADARRDVRDVRRDDAMELDDDDDDDE